MEILLSIQTLFLTLFLANPFAIEFPPKKDLTHEEYIEVQNKLREKDITPLIRSLYPTDSNLATFEDFLARTSRGFHQILIDPNKGQYPVTKLQKIGKGGKDCIVCCIPFNEPYPSHLNELIRQLEEVRFNGHIYYRIGGFPNPTGLEIQYAGVPYCFKVFAMIEAHQLGFDNILWVDARARPLQNLKLLFNWLELKGALINWTPHTVRNAFILPSTEDLLYKKTGTRVSKEAYANTILFGLKMSNPLVQTFIKSYYEMVQEGTPFLSCFPEEWVISAILNQPAFNEFSQRPKKLLAWANPEQPEYKKLHKRYVKKGFFFER